MRKRFPRSIGPLSKLFAILPLLLLAVVAVGRETECCDHSGG